MGMTRRVSARLRIVGLMLVVVAAALAITVLLLRQVLLAEQRTDVDNDLEQEARELQEFIRQAEDAGEQRDDESDREYTRRLLLEFLRTNVTDDDENLLAVQDGEAFRSSAGSPGSVVGDVQVFGNVTEPRFFDLDSDAGPVRLLAQPITSDDGEQLGLLAISWFTAEQSAQIDRTIRDAATPE